MCWGVKLECQLAIWAGGDGQMALIGSGPALGRWQRVGLVDESRGVMSAKCCRVNRCGAIALRMAAVGGGGWRVALTMVMPVRRCRAKRCEAGVWWVHALAALWGRARRQLTTSLPVTTVPVVDMKIAALLEAGTWQRLLLSVQREGRETPCP